jgi:hypothetical protein
MWIKLGILLGICTTLVDANTQGVSYLYAHGLAHHKEQAYWYLKQKPNGKINKHYIIDGRLFTFDFPDATQQFWRIHFPQCSLGQANDICSFYKAYADSREQLLAQKSSPDFILVGLSRGASVVLSFLGLFKAPNVKAAIVESPFDNLYNIVKAKLNLFDKIPGLTSITYSLIGMCFMQHKRHGICSLDVVEHIPEHLPLLIVVSKEDKTVPYQNTLELYKKLVESGHPHAYILILDTGRHSKLLKDDQGQLYQNVVHAFYKKYNLPHNPEFASLGQEMLGKCQPTLAELGLT